MIDFLKKLLNINISPKPDNKQSRHFKDLMTGPRVFIDGKPFVKVKLRFVDTLSFNITRHLDQLETEIESQKNELEKLSAVKTDLTKKINDLQALNINLFNDNVHRTKKLNEHISGLTLEKETQDTKISDLENKCLSLNNLISDLNAQLRQLNIIIGSKDNKIGSLEQEIHWIKKSKPDAGKGKRSRDKLIKNLKDSDHLINSKNKEIENKDKFIATMTQKIFEKELKIDELTLQINELLHDRINTPR
jgi:chromosome segregation ATPase